MAPVSNFKLYSYGDSTQPAKRRLEMVFQEDNASEDTSFQFRWIDLNGNNQVDINEDQFEVITQYKQSSLNWVSPETFPVDARFKKQFGHIIEEKILEADTMLSKLPKTVDDLNARSIKNADTQLCSNLNNGDAIKRPSSDYSTPLILLSEINPNKTPISSEGSDKPLQGIAVLRKVTEGIESVAVSLLTGTAHFSGQDEMAKNLAFEGQSELCHVSLTQNEHDAISFEAEASSPDFKVLNGARLLFLFYNNYLPSIEL